MFELSGVNYEEVLEQGDSILVRGIASSSYRGIRVIGIILYLDILKISSCVYVRVRVRVRVRACAACTRARVVAAGGGFPKYSKNGTWQRNNFRGSLLTICMRVHYQVSGRKNPMGTKRVPGLFINLYESTWIPTT